MLMHHERSQLSLPELQRALLLCDDVPRREALAMVDRDDMCSAARVVNEAAFMVKCPTDGNLFATQRNLHVESSHSQNQCAALSEVSPPRAGPLAALSEVSRHPLARELPIDGNAIAREYRASRMERECNARELSTGRGAFERENEYLKKNIEHLRQSKHQQENHISDLQKLVSELDEQVTHYKNMHNLHAMRNSGGAGTLEIGNLEQQLSAVQLVKDKLHKENLKLHNQVQDLRRQESKDGPTCVICMDNLANVVCLPCKHLALCSFCGQEGLVDSCPICRCHIESRMQIFMP